MTRWRVSRFAPRTRAERRLVRAVATCVPAGLVLLPFIGCASETKSVTVTRTVTVAQGDSVPRKAKPAKPQASERTQEQKQSGYTACDPSIQAWAATTTCEFAQNAFWHYWTSGRAETIRPYSPAARTSFDTYCTSTAQRVRCTTDDGAKVTFPVSAVDVYSQGRADTYAASHDLGPDPYEDLSLVSPDTEYEGTEEIEETSSDDTGCAAGYEPCIPPYPPDLDCADVGPVAVTGSDPHGLDADYDGRGCE